MTTLTLALAPTAWAQGTAPPPPPPGGPPPGETFLVPVTPAPPKDNRTATQKNLDAPGDQKVEKRDAAGFTFNDKPVRRTGGARIVHRAGPQATFPGFEQLPDGGSRLFVQLTANVPVEERRAQGSITYVLRGAHARVYNDTNELVTVHFNTPVSGARLLPSGNDTLFVVKLRANSTPTFKVQDNQDKTSTLMIDFPKGDFGGSDAVATDAQPDQPQQQRPSTRTGRQRKGGGAPPPAPRNAPPPAPPPPGPKP